MLPLLAELRTNEQAANRRGAVRRTLRLEVQTFSSQDATRALVRDLSVRGLLVETTADLAVGETIHVDLPEAGSTAARIVWANGSFFGCEFNNPVSKAAVSAALLLAPAEHVQLVSPSPEMPAGSYFGDERVRPEPASDGQTPANPIAVMVSLVVLLWITAMFIYALLALTFST